MNCHILFTSLTWNRGEWGKTHYLTEKKTNLAFNGYHFTHDVTNAKVLSITEAKKIANDISSRASVCVL